MQMKYINIIERLIQNGSYVRNDIGMGRVQYVKLITIEGKLFMIIVSEEFGHPIVAKVENIIVVNEEIVIFYDGEYEDIIKEEERDKYKDVIPDKEWNSIFGADNGRELEKNNFVSQDEGFYAEMHDTIEDYMEEGYDEKLSLEVCKYFGILL